MNYTYSFQAYQPGQLGLMIEDAVQAIEGGGVLLCQLCGGDPDAFCECSHGVITRRELAGQIETMRRIVRVRQTQRDASFNNDEIPF